VAEKMVGETAVAEQHSALRWLHEYGRRYPTAWQDYARLLADPPMHWADWCFCPLAGAYAVLSQGGRLPPELGIEVGPLGAIAAWRATQGIYRVYPTLLEELLATPVDGEVPAEVLLRLPEWCVYVETPGEPNVAGFFAFLEHDSHDDHAELRIVLDFIEPRVLANQIVHLGHGTLRAGFEAMLDASLRIARTRGGMPGVTFEQLKAAAVSDIARVERLVSVLLYLCADEADVPPRSEFPPRVVRTKKRPILPTPKRPTVHDCGLRMGVALDIARAQRAERPEGGGGASPAPHIRRAHWHTFWVGPRDGERARKVRWLPPIAVNLDDVPQFAVVRPVGSDIES
jgi:hypothetical protein